MKTSVYTSDDADNWLFNKYYCGGTNFRYWSFQLALNILRQTRTAPVVVETGCQRLPDDLGAGMSTSVFGEFLSRYGGRLHTVDLYPQHLEICKELTAAFKDSIEYISSDSIAWLLAGAVRADLLYLDSLDHPYGEMLEAYGGQENLEAAIAHVATLSHTEILKEHGEILAPCQEHCLNEFKAAESSGVVGSETLILIDDNQLPGGGKSRLLKNYLHESGWICLLDLQQTLWVSGV